MPRPDVGETLTRLLAVQFRSLPMYLADACPWLREKADLRITTALGNIAADQKHLCERIADYIYDHHGRVNTGEFPLSFTALHDLSMNYLLSQAVIMQRRLIQTIEQSVSELQDSPAARALAEESLGAARGHLEILENPPDPAAAPALAVVGHDAQGHSGHGNGKGHDSHAPAPHAAPTLHTPPSGH